MPDRQTTLATIRQVLMADFGCEQKHLLSDGVHLFPTSDPVKMLKGRRRFPQQKDPLSIATMGQGVVVSCSPNQLDWFQERLARLDRDKIFSPRIVAQLQNYIYPKGQTLAGPELKYVASPDKFCPASAPPDIELELLVGDAVKRLYVYPGFRNALSYRPQSPTPDVLASVARVDTQIVGIAAASADSEVLWQIGVDVRPRYQDLGIGKAVVSHLTAAIFDSEKIPYYTAVSSNLASRNLALGLGFWPAWVELYARKADAV